MNIRDDPDVRAFKDSAARFCQLLEARPTDPDLWVEELLGELARLYGCAHTLTNFELPDDYPFLPDELDVSVEEHRRITGLVGDVLGAQDFYGPFYDPSAPLGDRHDMVGSLLSDDLADIYRDVKPGLRALQTGGDEYLPGAVFDWRFSSIFASHWGVHAVSAMWALHPIAFFLGVRKSGDRLRETKFEKQLQKEGTKAIVNGQPVPHGRWSDFGYYPDILAKLLERYCHRPDIVEGLKTASTHQESWTEDFSPSDHDHYVSEATKILNACTMNGHWAVMEGKLRLLTPKQRSQQQLWYILSLRFLWGRKNK